MKNANLHIAIFLSFVLPIWVKCIEIPNSNFGYKAIEGGIPEYLRKKYNQEKIIMTYTSNNSGPDLQ